VTDRRLPGKVGAPTMRRLHNASMCLFEFHFRMLCGCLKKEEEEPSNFTFGLVKISGISPTVSDVQLYIYIYIYIYTCIFDVLEWATVYYITSERVLNNEEIIE
jgi:hypothetical protein